MPNTAIKVSHLTKVYKLYDKPIDRLKESLHPLGKKYHKDFYALSDVSFEIKKGETVGIIGKNGAGKSTLLKIITGVLTPSSGHVHVNGRIASLLELGAGFNPEYTGIENIYLQGTLMGYSHEEMETKIDEILAFADIGDFIHQPVKMYSSGMFARLAFAVAINVEPDILIVDEALSVGDMLFQTKCLYKMSSLKEKGVTILFVSHDVHSIRTLCNKSLYLNNGEIIIFGNVKEVVDIYISDSHISSEKISYKLENMQLVDSLSVQNDNDDCVPILVSLEDSIINNGILVRYGNMKIAQILDTAIINSEYQKTHELISGKMYFIQFSILFKEDLPTFVVGAAFTSQDGVQQLAWLNSQDNIYFPSVKKNNIYVASIKVDIPIRAGIYTYTVAVEYPNINNIQHEPLDVLKNIGVINVNFETPQHQFHSMFYTKGSYFLEKIKD